MVMHTNCDKTRSNIMAYFNRIGYKGSTNVSLKTLSQLQECHIYTVPYENLDILNGVPLSLEIPNLFDKIVTRNRGGYCFELNTLFGWLLQSLGFEVTNYFARFWRDEPSTPAKRRHQVLGVKVEDVHYLCDVGVGGLSPLRPIKITNALVNEQNGEYYKLEHDTYFGWILYEKKRGQWCKIYSFTEEPQLPQDYITTSFWCENAEDSPFTKRAKVAIRTTIGRNTIADNEFRIFTPEGVRVFVPKTLKEYNKALYTHFGITMNDKLL